MLSDAGAPGNRAGRVRLAAIRFAFPPRGSAPAAGAPRAARVTVACPRYLRAAGACLSLRRAARRPASRRRRVGKLTIKYQIIAPPSPERCLKINRNAVSLAARRARFGTRNGAGYLILEAIAQERCIEPLSDPRKRAGDKAGLVVDTGNRSWIGMSIPDVLDPKDAEP